MTVQPSQTGTAKDTGHRLAADGGLQSTRMPSLEIVGINPTVCHGLGGRLRPAVDCDTPSMMMMPVVKEQDIQ